jgi:type I restriction enzyme M protein
VIIEDEALRGYVYQFLLSPMGQHHLTANIYGAIVVHIEPDEVKQVIVPIPNDRELVEKVGLKVMEAVSLQEMASNLDDESREILLDSLLPEQHEGSTPELKRVAEPKAGYNPK